MAFEQRDNSGAIFKNDRREKDTHPDRTGTAMIDGVEYWVSGWLKEDRGGNPFLSLAFKRKEAKRREEPQRRPAVANSRRGDMDDEIPF